MQALPLEEDEADAVLLGLCLVARWGDAGTVLAAERAIARIDALLPEPPPPATPLPGGPPSASPDEAATRVGAAIAAACRLRLLYRDGEQQWSRRTVWPIDLTDGPNADLLVASCETRAAFRHFRLDRIEHAEPLGDRFGAARQVLVARYRADVMERTL